MAAIYSRSHYAGRFYAGSVVAAIGATVEGAAACTCPRCAFQSHGRLSVKVRFPGGRPMYLHHCRPESLAEVRPVSDGGEIRRLLGV